MKLNTLFLGGMVFAAVATVSHAYADDSVLNAGKINEINQQIQKSGAQWRAKETWVSKLSQTDFKRMLGSNSQPKGKLDYTNDRTGTAPASVDWRNQNGMNWVGPVMNQGNCGSCVAFSTVGTLEAQVSISAGLPWLHPTFSPDQLFACGGGGCDSGWEPGDAARFLKSTGIVDAACAPDTMGSTGNDVSCGTVTSGCADAAARTYKISGSTSPSGGLFGGMTGNVEKVKEALTHGPLVTTLTVYTDFLTYTGGIYKSVSGKAEGGHAVSIVGYDTATRVWIIRNSWGPDWGEGGFARVSWDDRSGVASETWQFQVPADSEYMTVTTPAENEYVSGQYQTKVSNNSHANVNIEIRKAGSDRAVTTLACIQSDGGCVSAVDTSQLPDGRYEMVANTGTTNGFSQVRSFWVVNTAPENLSLHYVGAAGVDLTKPLSDRPTFNLTTTTSGVPFHSIRMMVRQNGKILSERETDVVLPAMVLGFRTNTLPNGVYEFFFRGELTAAGQSIVVDSNIEKLTFQN
jgi:hypothetical protein